MIMFRYFDYYNNDYNYWWGSLWQLFVMTVFLINIWQTQNCSGISLKSQVLYALAFTTRHKDLTSYHNGPQTIGIKIAFLSVTYGTVLSIFKRFSKTYDKLNDAFRIDIPIASCLVLSLCLIINDNFYFSLWPIMIAFSAYIEAIAMVPQFQFILKSGQINKSVFLYILGMAFFAFLQLVYFFFNRTWDMHTLRIMAATVQFLLYCDFLHKVYPLICSQIDQNEHTTSRCHYFSNICSFLRQQSKDIEADVEDESIKTGHIASNVGSFVLTPSTIVGVHKNKEFPEGTKEKILE